MNPVKILVRKQSFMDSEWLYYYESYGWVFTGEWLGGGTKHKK